MFLRMFLRIVLRRFGKENAEYQVRRSKMSETVSVYKRSNNSIVLHYSGVALKNAPLQKIFFVLLFMLENNIQMQFVLIKYTIDCTR